MTKEELEKEADKALDKRMGTYAYINRMNVQTPYTDGYKDGAEPREKRIAELEKQLAISEHDREHNDYELTEVYKKIEVLKKENAELKEELTKKADTNHLLVEQMADLESENAELRKVAEFQQSSNMSRHFENKKLKEGLAVGSTFNKALNSMNKSLEEERDKYRNMVFDLEKENAELKDEYRYWLDIKDNNLTKAKEIIKSLLPMASNFVFGTLPKLDEEVQLYRQAEQFLNSEVEK